MKNDNKYRELRQKAESLLKAKGLEKPEHYYQDIEKLVEELNIHQIELEMQNQELRETTDKLSVEQKRYKELYMNAPIAYFTLNETGNIVELNNAAAKMLNIPIQKFKYTSIFPYLEENSKKQFSQYFKKIFNSENTEYGEIVFIDDNGKPIFTTLSAIAYFDTELKSNLVRCTVNNISAIKQFEREIQIQKKLLDSENRIRTLFYQNGVIMLIIDPETGQIEDANPAACSFYGYTTDKMKKMNISEINQLSDAEIKTEIENTKKFGKKYFNFKHKLSNGEIRDVEVYSNSIHYNEKVKLFSIIHDITERKQAEKQKEYLSAIIENTENICVIKDLDLRVIATNDSFVKATGKSSVNELIGKTDAEIFQVSPDEEPVKKYMEDERKVQKLKKGEKLLTEEPVLYPDGIKHTVLTCKFPIFNQELLIATGNVSTDITDLKKIEQELKNKTEQLKIAQIIAKLGDWKLNINTFDIILSAEHQMMLNEKAVQVSMSLFEYAEKYIVPEDISIIKDRLNYAIANNNNNYSDNFEYRVKTEKNEIRHFAVTSRWKEKDTIYGVTQDITDRKKAEQELRESEEKYSKLFSSSLIPIWLLDQNGKILQVNQAVIDKLGYTYEELLTMRISDFEVVQTEDEIKAKIEELFKTKNQSFETKHKTKDGTILNILVNSTVIQLNNQEYILSATHNITEIRKAEAEIKKYAEELKEANQTKDRFISIMAHDLRSPFNSILGFASLLAKKIDKYDKEKIKKFAETIHQSASNTYNLLLNLLEWSRSQRGKIQFKPEEINLYNLVQDTYLLSKQTADEKGIKINKEIASELSIEIDQEMIKTVIRNLLSNAIKYTDENGEISILAKQNHENVAIHIKDNGIGMSKEIQNSLFKIDETKSQTGTKGEKGTGFGLLLSKEFVDKHNGKIKVKSELGKGSEFIVTLPLKQAQEQIDNEIKQI